MAGQHERFPCCGHAQWSEDLQLILSCALPPVLIVLGDFTPSLPSLSVVSMRNVSLFHYFFIVWFQKISILPPRKRFAVWPTIPLSGFSKIGSQNLPPPPPPLRISNIFAHPLEILLSLIEVSKEGVLFTRMPNFVSFQYFLLKCITDKGIPYANSLCAQVTNKFCEFSRIFCWILQQISESFLAQFTKKLFKKFLATSKWNARSRGKYNCTFL